MSSKTIPRFFLAFVVLSAADILAGEAGVEPVNPSDPAPDFAGAAEWLLNQPEVEAQAVGLLTLTAPWRARNVTVDRERVTDSIRALLARTQEPAELHLLALACAQARIQAECIELGLDTALVVHDQGNLLSRGLLIGRDAETWRALIMSRPAVRSINLRLAPLVRRQMARYETVTPQDRIPIVSSPMGSSPIGSSIQTLAIVFALPSVSYSSWLDQCTDAAGDLREACWQAARQAASGSSDLITQRIALAILRGLSNDEAVADDLQTYSDDLMGFATCVHASLPEEYRVDTGWGQEELIDRWLNQYASVGELGTLIQMNQKLELGCSLPAQPTFN